MIILLPGPNLNNWPKNAQILGAFRLEEKNNNNIYYYYYYLVCIVHVSSYLSTKT